MQIPINRFLGIDRQPASDWKAGSLLEAYNVEIMPNGPLKRRPALVYRAALPAASGGLYEMGDSVHVAAPDGTDISGLTPTVNVDLLTLTGGGSTIEEVHGIVSDASGKPLLMLSDDLAALRVHQAESTNASPSGATVVSLPFTPVPARLAKIASRAYMLDAGVGARLLRYSAVDDPAGSSAITEWDPAADPDDATKRGGFENIGQHHSGGGSAVGIAEFNERVAVFFRTAIQVWRFGADPENDAYLEKVITGPGLKHAQGLAQVGQDVYFLSPDLSVQSLSRASLTEGAEDQTIGTPIEPLLESTWTELITPRAIHSRSRGQFLLALGQDVFCLGLIPGRGLLGWTRWRMPVAVDGWAETGDTLWMRSGDTLYSFSDEEAQDEVTEGGFQDIPVRIETQDVVRGPNYKTVQRVSATLTESAVMQVVRDNRPSLAVDGSLPAGLGTRITMAPRSPEPSQVVCSWPCRTMRVRIHDDAAGASWRLEGLTIDLQDHRHPGIR